MEGLGGGVVAARKTLGPNGAALIGLTEHFHYQSISPPDTFKDQTWSFHKMWCFMGLPMICSHFYA